MRDPVTGYGLDCPPEYLVYLACKLYRCTPSQIIDEDFATVVQHLRFQQIEYEAAQSAR